MKISKQKAVKLFVALGLKNADKWNDERLSSKLAKVNEMVDEDVKLEDEEAATLDAVRAAVAAGEEFEIESDGDVAADAPVAEKPTKKKGQTDEEKAAAKAAKEKEAADKKAAKEAERAAKKAEREANKGRRTLPRKMKTDATPGNHEFSGQVMAEFGLPDEITKEMCDRHCELRNKVNDDAVDYLTYAWKIITSYKKAMAAKKAG